MQVHIDALAFTALVIERLLSGEASYRWYIIPVAEYTRFGAWKVITWMVITFCIMQLSAGSKIMVILIKTMMILMKKEKK